MFERYMLKMRSLAHADDGAALTELVIVAPLLLILLIGLIEVGRFAQYSILVANAARAGVQYGAQDLGTAGDVTGIQTAAQNDANVTGLTVTPIKFCQCADGTASACLQTDCPTPNHRLVFVQVDVSGTIPSLLNYPGVPASQTVTSRAVMRVAQ